MRSQARNGAFTVLTTAAAMMSVTASFVLSAPLPLAAQATLVPLIGLLCLVGLYCLWGIRNADPGVIQRSPATCLPLPRELQLQLDEGVPHADLNLGPNQGNWTDTERNASFCARCYVWRPLPGARQPTGCVAARCGIGVGFAKAAHHCRTCARCVRDFDHHCGFFGRCIAGKGSEGNMRYFTTIIVCAQLGSLVTIGSVIASAVALWGGVVGVFATLGCLVGLLCVLPALLLGFRNACSRRGGGPYGGRMACSCVLCGKKHMLHCHWC